LHCAQKNNFEENFFISVGRGKRLADIKFQVRAYNSHDGRGRRRKKNNEGHQDIEIC
jgi:hypothetical protein